MQVMKLCCCHATMLFEKVYDDTIHHIIFVTFVMTVFNFAAPKMSAGTPFRTSPPIQTPTNPALLDGNGQGFGVLSRWNCNCQQRAAATSLRYTPTVQQQLRSLFVSL